MINEIRIARFKSIKDLTFPLEGITVLVGPNNAGKSSVLQAIQFATSVCQSLNNESKSAINWSRSSSVSGTLSAEQLIYTPLRDVQALARGGSLRQDEARAIEVTMRRAVGGENEEVVVSVSRGKNKNVGVRVSGNSFGKALADLDLPFSAVAPGLAGIPSKEEYHAPGIVRRAAARGDANSVFRNVLWTLHQDSEAWQEFIDRLAVVFTDVDLRFKFNQDTDEHITVEMKRDNAWLPIDSAGTGILQAVQVLSYIGVYRPRLLILDEPDSHLHPDNQRKLARLLDQLTRTTDLQVLLSTHSRHFLDEFESLGAKIHWLSDGNLRHEEFDYVRVLLDLGALDAGDRLREGSAPLVVVTEDNKPAMLENIILSSGLNKEDFDIWSYAGSSKVEAAIVLGHFIRKTSPSTQVLVHRDRDYLSEADVAKFKKRLEDVNLHSFITNGTDIESHLLNSSYLCSLYPTLSSSEVDGLIDRATESAKEASLKIMIDDQVAAAFQVRNMGEISRSAGTIGVEAPKEFELDPSRFRHGKKTLGQLKALLQGELKLDPRRIGSEPHEDLSVPYLSDLAAMIHQAPIADPIVNPEEEETGSPVNL